MMGNPGAERMEMPDNRNDQARAHLLARESAEEGSRKTTGEVLPENRGICNQLKSNRIKKCLTEGI
jgi:hypothetical protein